MIVFQELAAREAKGHFPRSRLPLGSAGAGIELTTSRVLIAGQTIAPEPRLSWIMTAGQSCDLHQPDSI